MDVPILMYHSVARDEDAAPSDFVVNESTFRRQLEFLARRGYRTVSAREIVERRVPPNERTVMITFDDGYLDNYEVALPLLRAFNFNACVFAVADFLRRKNWW